MSSNPQPDAAVQTFGTDGVKPMARPSAITRFFMNMVAGAEKLNLKFATLGYPPVYDNAAFPWAKDIEREWRTIRVELDNVLIRREELPSFQDIVEDVSTITQDHGWKTFFLTGYGARFDRNIEQCPQTWRIVRKIPGLKTAMFSIFEPSKHLPAHRGPYNGVLRLHLGLIVPDEPRGTIAIRVGKEICHWDEGKVLIFDDAYEHEAWNHSDKVRVVLFVDFVNPLRFSANVVNWFLLNLAVFTPFVQESNEKHKKWEARFYGRS